MLIYLHGTSQTQKITVWCHTSPREGLCCTIFYKRGYKTSKSPFRATMQTPKVVELMNAIADDASLELFKLVAQANYSGRDLKSKTKLTRKQYYSRLHRLIQCGVIKRKETIYSVTTLGKILFEAQATVESALKNLWRIQAIDSLDMTDGIPLEERHLIVEKLITDQGLKNILTK
jgi:hypothetical protein